DHHLPPPRQSGQGEQHGGGVVVDDEGGLGAGQGGEQLAGVAVAAAAAPLGQVVLEVGVPHGNRLDGVHRVPAERGAAEVGVQQDAGGIDDGHHPPAAALLEEPARRGGQLGQGGRGSALPHGGPGLRDDPASGSRLAG